MRIPGVLLAVPVTLVAVDQQSDGPVDVDEKKTKAHLITREVVTQGPSGATITLVTKARVRATVKVAGRAPQAGDEIRIDDATSTIESVEKVRGPGREVAYLELTTGNG